MEDKEEETLEKKKPSYQHGQMWLNGQTLELKHL